MATVLHGNVKMLCKENNISIRQLEVVLNFKPNTISSWAHTLPSSGKVLKVANYFDVSIDFLLGNCNNRYSHKTTLSEGTLIIMSHAERLKISETTAYTTAKLMEVINDDAGR